MLAKLTAFVKVSELEAMLAFEMDSLSDSSSEILKAFSMDSVSAMQLDCGMVLWLDQLSAVMFCSIDSC